MRGVKSLAKEWCQRSRQRLARNDPAVLVVVDNVVGVEFGEVRLIQADIHPLAFGARQPLDGSVVFLGGDRLGHIPHAEPFFLVETQKVAQHGPAAAALQEMIGIIFRESCRI